MRRTLRFGPRSIELFLPLLLAGVMTAGLNSAGAQELVTEQSAHVASAETAGPAQPDVRLDRMLLVLEPGPQKRVALDNFLTAQQTPGNAYFHKWLTAAQFADRFSASATDAAAVTAWLHNQGFVVAALPAGRGWIEFSGTVAQVERAFGARVKSPAGGVSGTKLYWISGSLQGSARTPASIASLVKGLASLDGSLSTAAATDPMVSGTSLESLTAESSLKQSKAITPAMLREWLGFSTKSGESSTGAGESIAIPARSNVRQEDFTAFRRSFDLPEAVLEVRQPGSQPGSQTGEETSEDPGRTSDEAATIAAASWAGVAAPQAKIVLVPVASTNATDGVDLALAATVDGAFAHTISMSYTTCESRLSTAHREFYATAYRQAAAQGIAIIAATGDSGAAACHLPGSTSLVSTGRGVNGMASTPWNTAVAAVAFTPSADGITGWASNTSTTGAYATGGGVSRVYATPDWQSAAGLPSSDPDTAAAHHRYLPDVSIPSTGWGQGLAFCFSGDTAFHGCRLVTGGGSAASAAIFSGIAALLAEKYGAQGNLAPNLYALRRSDTNDKSAPSFLDITAGSAKLACKVGSPDCLVVTSEGAGSTTGEIGFTAGPGFDLVSGLGSIHGQELVANWANPQAIGTANVTVEMTNTGGLTYNPSAAIVLSAKVLSGSGGTVPTGTVQFYDQTTSGNTGTPVTLAADGTGSYTEKGQFTSGGHNIAAIYSGDSTYISATSQPVTINIQPSPTVLVVTPSTTTPVGGSSLTVMGTVTSSNPGASPPTGTLTVTLDGVAAGNTTVLTTGTATSGSVVVTVPTAGSHAIQGTYSGDLNYTGSTSPAVTLIVPKSPSVTSISATPAALTTGVPETFTATVAPSIAAAGVAYVLTGSVSFYDAASASLLGTVAVSSNTAILTGVTLSNTLSHTVTAVYSGDATYSASTSSPLVLASTLLPVTVTLVASNSVLTPNQPVTLVATVTPINTPPLTAEQNPSGFVLFYASGTLISGQTEVLVGLGHSGVASTFVPHLPAGQYVLTAQYSGDPTYGPAVSNSLNLQIEDFAITSTISNIDLKQGQSATVPFTVSSKGGFTGPIQVACEEQNPPQNGAIQCTFSPSIVNGTQTSTLTVITSTGAIARNDGRSSPLLPAAGGSVALAFVGLLLWPVGRRARRLRARLRAKSCGQLRSKTIGRMLVLLWFLAGILGAGVGCTNTVTVNTTRGTPLGVHTLKITAASYVNTVTVSHNAYLTVNVTP